MLINKARYDAFRIGEYDPHEVIKPWNLKSTKPRDNIDSCKKTIKPNKADFAHFKDDATWHRYKERITTTLDSQGLLHLIDDAYKPHDTELDNAQQKWLYKVLQDCLLASSAKNIVTSHLNDKDTRKVWKELCVHYDSSMTTAIRCQTTSTYLTSSRAHTANWRGTQQNYILHWAEQARMYNEMSPEKYSDNQLIGFLEANVSGTSNLAQVRTIHMTASRAGGNYTPWSFAEYVSELINAASIQDSANTSTQNPRSSRCVNTHKLVFEDNVEEDIMYDTNVHDMDTPFTEINAHDHRSNGGQPR